MHGELEGRRGVLLSLVLGGDFGFEGAMRAYAMGNGGRRANDLCFAFETPGDGNAAGPCPFGFGVVVYISY